MRVFRQGGQFVLIGLLQLLIDSALYVALSASGIPPALANFAGRLSGACVGFWLNGRFTFASDGQARLGRQRLLRFACAWLFFTGLSSLLIAALASYFGVRSSWLFKPALEAALAVLSFFVSRHWVYR